jgi:uncharacterized protein (TIGR04255 family)
MPRHKKTYGASPIAEAVYEVFVEPRPDLEWTRETAVVIRDAVDGFTGRHEELQDVAMKVSFRQDEVQHGLRRPPPRFRWWHENEQRAIQVGANMCAHNVLAPYSEYESYVGTTERLFAVYLEQTAPVRVSWTGQRYINEVRVPVENGPADHFTIYPAVELPGQRHPDMALQVETARFQDVSTVTNLVFRRADKEVAVYILDIYARSNQPLERSPGALIDWHARAHDTISESFEFSITDRAREAFKEEK